VGLKKIALIPGHTAKSPGAFSQALHEYEYAWALEFTKALCMALIPTFDCQIYMRDGHTIEETYRIVSDWIPDASIECHFNSDISGVARGTETLCALRHQNFGILIQNSMVIALERFGKLDRGLELIHPGDSETRGWASCQAEFPQALIEPFFGSNQQDSDLFGLKQEAVISGILRSLSEYFDQVDPGWAPGTEPKP
jgi:N-acetylmuramoyl-L-alanine amidase